MCRRKNMNSFFLLEDRILLESRISDLKTKYPNVDIDYFVEKDPSPSKKYVAWAAQKADEGKNKEEILNLIYSFHKNVKRMQKKDIFQYSFDELKNEINSLGKTSKEIKEEGSKTVYEDKEYIVKQILSKEASCEYGKGTKWCVAATKDENQFEYYRSRDVHLFFLFRKKPQKDPYDKIGIAISKTFLFSADEEVGSATTFFDSKDNAFFESKLIKIVDFEKWKIIRNKIIEIVQSSKTFSEKFKEDFFAGKNTEYYADMFLNNGRELYDDYVRMFRTLAPVTFSSMDLVQDTIIEKHKNNIIFYIFYVYAYQKFFSRDQNIWAIEKILNSEDRKAIFFFYATFGLYLSSEIYGKYLYTSSFIERFSLEEIKEIVPQDRVTLSKLFSMFDSHLTDSFVSGKAKDIVRAILNRSKSDIREAIQYISLYEVIFEEEFRTWIDLETIYYCFLRINGEIYNTENASKPKSDQFLAKVTQFLIRQMYNIGTVRPSDLLFKINNNFVESTLNLDIPENLILYFYRYVFECFKKYTNSDEEMKRMLIFIYFSIKSVEKVFDIAFEELALKIPSVYSERDVRYEKVHYYIKTKWPNAIKPVKW